MSLPNPIVAVIGLGRLGGTLARRSHAAGYALEDRALPSADRIHETVFKTVDSGSGV